MDSQFGALENLLGPDRVTRKMEDRLTYSYDATARQYLPDVVVFPEKTSEVAEILKFANANKLPVVPRGAGSGLTGGALPVKSGIVMVMTGFDRIIEIDAENMVAVVQPGVVTARFKKRWKSKDCFIRRTLPLIFFPLSGAILPKTPVE